MKNRDAEYWIDKLELMPHPEGGYFKETYRAPEDIPEEALPDRFSGSRSNATSIYFLLKSDQVSTFHRIKSDELWHFHLGAPLTIHMLSPMAEYRSAKIGTDSFQAIVPQGWWFGAEVDKPDSFTLVGCTVSPGFDFADFELANCTGLSATYPKYSDLIQRLTHKH